jgi:hypothetical protein
VADQVTVTVGIPVVEYSPHRSVRALTSAFGSYLRYGAAWRYSDVRTPTSPWDTPSPPCVGSVWD